MAVSRTGSIAADFLKALGLDIKGAKKAVITIEAGDIVTVDVTRYVDQEFFNPNSMLIEKYKVVPKKQMNVNLNGRDIQAILDREDNNG